MADKDEPELNENELNEGEEGEGENDIDNVEEKIKNEKEHEKEVEGKEEADESLSEVGSDKLDDERDDVRLKRKDKSRKVPKFKHPSYKVGEAIVKDLPIVFTLLQSRTNYFCFNCLKPAKLEGQAVYYVETLTQCSDCKSASYCSDDCKTNDVFHQLECKIFQKMPPPPTSIARICVRILIILRFNGKNYLTQKRDYFHVRRSFTSLEMFRASLEENKTLINEFNQSIEYIRRLGSDYFPANSLPKSDDYDEVEKYLVKFINNSIKLYDKDGPYAVALYMRTSLFSHNCRPNAIISIDGHLLKVRAVKAIQANELITVCVVDPFDLYEKRHNDLKQYNYNCNCENNDKEIKLLKESYKSIEEISLKLRGQSTPDKIILEELFKKWTRLIKQMETIIPFHPLVLERYLQFFKTMIELDHLAKFPIRKVLSHVKKTHGRLHSMYILLHELLIIASEKKSANKKIITLKDKFDHKIEEMKQKLISKSPKLKKYFELDINE